ncbi:hypothetical protein EFY87_12060 [Flexivirga caeni]|uniref:Uncharacterized protein n=2 Tax=Flexivirga caeni TaxID=2294115 RepID=A0A3M9M744_9MICO|nr:hypothetical protein EFY87_12060 [Flexivirga caeni]
MRVRRFAVAGLAPVVLAVAFIVSIVPSRAAPGSGARGQTDAALAASATRLHGLDNLRAAIDAVPSRYGGVATEGDASVTACDTGNDTNASADEGPTASVDNAIAALRQEGAAVTVKPCRYSLDDLHRVLAQVTASSLFAANGVTLRRWGIDYSANAVEIGVDATPSGFAAKVAAQWGSAVYLTVSPSVGLQSTTTMR